jgi:hypothetical protein
MPAIEVALANFISQRFQKLSLIGIRTRRAEQLALAPGITILHEAQRIVAELRHFARQIAHLTWDELQLVHLSSPCPSLCRSRSASARLISIGPPAGPLCSAAKPPPQEPTIKIRPSRRAIHQESESLDLRRRPLIAQNDGKLVIESKAEMAKRGIASPDDADALALTFACSVAAEPVVAEPKNLHRTGGYAHYRRCKRRLAFPDATFLNVSAARPALSSQSPATLPDS